MSTTAEPSSPVFLLPAPKQHGRSLGQQQQQQQHRIVPATSPGKAETAVATNNSTTSRKRKLAEPPTSPRAGRKRSCSRKLDLVQQSPRTLLANQLATHMNLDLKSPQRRPLATLNPNVQGGAQRQAAVGKGKAKGETSSRRHHSSTEAESLTGYSSPSSCHGKGGELAGDDGRLLLSALEDELSSPVKYSTPQKPSLGESFDRGHVGDFCDAGDEGDEDEVMGEDGHLDLDLDRRHSLLRTPDHSAQSPPAFPSMFRLALSPILPQKHLSFH